MSFFATNVRSVRSAALRALTVSTALVAALPTLSYAQEPSLEPAGPVNLLAPSGGLMFWTLLIFAVLVWTLSKYAFPPLFKMVEQREQALEEAVQGAKRDRAEAAELLKSQLAAIESAKVDAQKIIADSRQTAEKVRADLIDATKAQQTEMLENARRVIESEKVAAIADMRMQAIELAIAGAGKVISQNLDSASNRQIVEGFLASLDTQPTKR